MFTGIIEELGQVESVEHGESGARLKVACFRVLSDANVGVSIAVNGCCLTAVELSTHAFIADLAPETLNRTDLGSLQAGSLVNLERPLLPTTRLSGHIVQGHVDGTAELTSLTAAGDGNWWLRLQIPESLARYVVEKGSIAIDGISLTVAAIQGNDLTIAIIPHTFENTNLANRAIGDRLNIEVDMLAKHVEKLLR